MWPDGDGGRSSLPPFAACFPLLQLQHRAGTEGTSKMGRPTAFRHMTCFDCVGFRCRLWSFSSRKKRTTAHLRPDESERTVPLKSRAQLRLWLVDCMRPSVPWDYGTAWVGNERTGWTNLRPLGECSFSPLLQIFPVLASDPWSGCLVSRSILFSPTLRNI